MNKKLPILTVDLCISLCISIKHDLKLFLENTHLTLNKQSILFMPEKIYHQISTILKTLHEISSIKVTRDDCPNRGNTSNENKSSHAEQLSQTDNRLMTTDGLAFLMYKNCCMVNPLVPRVPKIKICNLNFNRLLIIEFVKKIFFLALTIVSVRD